MNAGPGKDYRDTLDVFRGVLTEIYLSGCTRERRCPPGLPVAECPQCRRAAELSCTATRLREALEREAP